jgi:hypothetical protein
MHINERFVGALTKLQEQHHFRIRHMPLDDMDVIDFGDKTEDKEYSKKVIRRFYQAFMPERAFRFTD